MTPRDRRALIIGGSVAGLAIVCLKLMPWMWQTVKQQGAEVQARAELLERMRADVREAGWMEDSAVVVKGRWAMLAPKLLTGGSASEATAGLGAILSAIASRHRVRITLTDPVIDTTRSRGLRRGGVRAVLESDTRGLLELLDAVGREPVLVMIDSLRVTVADPLVSGRQSELLRTELMVSGWFLPTEDVR